MLTKLSYIKLLLYNELPTTTKLLSDHTTLPFDYATKNIYITKSKNVYELVELLPLYLLLMLVLMRRMSSHRTGQVSLTYSLIHQSSEKTTTKKQ